MGYHIADIIVFGVDAIYEGWQPQPARNEVPNAKILHVDPSSLANGSSISGMAALPTTAPATTQPPASSSALALAP